MSCCSGIVWGQDYPCVTRGCLWRWLTPGKAAQPWQKGQGSTAALSAGTRLPISSCGEKVGNNNSGPAQQGLSPLTASLIHTIFKEQTTFKASLDLISPCVCSHCPGQAVLLHFICRLPVTHGERGHPPTATAVPGLLQPHSRCNSITGIAMACAVAQDELQLPTAALSSHHFLCMSHCGLLGLAWVLSPRHSRWISVVSEGKRDNPHCCGCHTSWDQSPAVQRTKHY